MDARYSHESPQEGLIYLWLNGNAFEKTRQTQNEYNIYMNILRLSLL